MAPVDLDRAVEFSESVMRIIEVVAAFVLVLLFAIGVFDLGLQILARTRTGAITDPEIVVGFIDTALLLFIIVEVYETVIAYTHESETQEIVTLVIYTGIIAMVRKGIIFRTGEYATTREALMAAFAYTVILLGLAALLFVNESVDAD